jgi:hypothetical protein
MSGAREAGFAVYLVDPGPNLPGVLGLIQEVAGLTTEAAAESLREFPSVVGFFESEQSARDLAARFREFDAVAVVRPAGQPLAPAPVEEVDTLPAQRVLRVVLLLLGVGQLGVCVLWFREGRWAAAFFGLLLALYVLVYFGRKR